MTEGSAKAAAKARVAELVSHFASNEADYLRAEYNETQARTDFITPLLEALGWDVRNVAGKPLAFREVIEEATVEVGEERLSKKPDYELRLARQRKLFVEAKKPNVRIDRDRAPAFQTRRYGYSASLPISVLTNFAELVVYDCQSRPSQTDEAHVARMLDVQYKDFERRFEELWPLLAREEVYSGAFDRRFAVDVTRKGSQQFDDFFLGQVRSWRERLARDIHANTPGLSTAELTYAVQLFLSRIVFLRICEDREIERYENLKGLPAAATFDALMAELRRADAFYDSGLFSLLDDARLGLRVSDAVLHSIFSELYYPQSPYTFAVVETEVLGEIYEQFLGEIITVNGGAVEIVSKPEVRESGGVVPTPRYVVDAIVQRTLVPALEGKSPADLEEFTVADVCCGSGIFLLSVYEFLLEHYLSWYLANNREEHVGRTIFEVEGGQWRLTFDEKRRTLLRHLRGVDIDANAVEVTRFSLLLKLIEGETGEGLREFVQRTHTPALPSLKELVVAGNSLVSPAEWAHAVDPMPAALVEKVNPLDWAREFPAELARGGFDVVVANPPYIRIQNMVEYSPEEVAYYQNARSPYSTAREKNFDKYALFIERSLGLLRDAGRLGVIVSHKFMVTPSGKALRKLISDGRYLEEVVHFGVKPVFGRDVSNYTCILVLDHRGLDTVKVEKVTNLEAWRYGQTGSLSTIPSGELGEEPWEFADVDTRALFDRVRAAHPDKLGQVADLYVGPQTSADAIYVFEGVSEDAGHVVLRWGGRDWPIEKGILRACMLNVPIEPYARPKRDSWVIFPYEIVLVRGKPKAKLIQPDEMARRFTRCLEYLEARRPELERRAVSGGVRGEQQFYQYGRSQALNRADGEKIIVRTLSLEARYAFDDTNIIVTGGGNGPYNVVRAKPGRDTSHLYLLAVLHHPLSEALVRTKTSVFRGGFYSHMKQYIANLPIPCVGAEQRAAIEALVRELIAAKDAHAAARTEPEETVLRRRCDALRTQIEEAVSTAFGLSPEDMAIVRAVPIPG